MLYFEPGLKDGIVTVFPNEGVVDEAVDKWKDLWCCGCEYDCSSSGGVWIRSVLRKHGEFTKWGRYYIPGLDHLRAACVKIENEFLALREMVCRQQGTMQELYMEWDKERNDASSATSEAIPMILKL
ncbi:hypothetical protein Droror1_Dr00019920 [Drosera rotundifolia]